MKSATGLFAGLIAAFVASFGVMVIVPKAQFGALSAKVDADTGDVRPLADQGGADRGKLVYEANGCIHCHTQQVRPEHAGPEIARKWGARQTVARDYMYDLPPLLGLGRLGPDLANIGGRKDAGNPDKYGAAWHYLHLYDPAAVVADSGMPPYRHLFLKRRISGAVSADALKLPAGREAAPGFEVVPTPDAKALVAYLMSLDRNYPVDEARIKEEEAQ